MKPRIVLTWIVVVGVMAVVNLAGQERVDFSGVWQIDHERSKFSRPRTGPFDMQLKVGQSADTLALTLRVNEQGRRVQHSFRFRVDGQESINELNGAELKSRLEWPGRTLAVNSVAVFNNRELRMKDRWTLSEDGKTMTQEQWHQFGSEPAGTELVVFTRRPDSEWEKDFKPQAAEEAFKNIQVLKGTPAQQIPQTMMGFARALGVQCVHCHVPNAFEKDEKPAKQTARRMIRMLQAIRETKATGESAVTCWTCHRGQTRPELTPPAATVKP